MNQRLSPRRTLIAALLSSVLLTACLSDAAEPTLDLDLTPVPGTAIALPTPTLTPTVEPTPSIAPWIVSLLEPGPTGLVSPVIFFQNGPDLWIVNSDLSVTQVTEGRRVRTTATMPGTSSAAVVLIDTTGGRETEEVRIIDGEGNESEPVYGPEIVSDPGGNPRIASMSWAPDGQQLAIVRKDDSIWLTGPGRTAEQLTIEDPPEAIDRVRWSPGGDALMILQRSTNETSTVRILPLDTDGFYTLLPLGSFGNAAWMPGQGRIVVAEERTSGFNPHAGSLFTLQPDGTDRELLISAGEFGPAVRIGHLLPSPDGTLLAFTVEMPNTDGEMRFQSLQVLEVATGIHRTAGIAPGQIVSDLWWFEGGLGWRAIDAGEGGTYSGVEPFVIEVFDLETGETSLIYTSAGD